MSEEKKDDDRFSTEMTGVGLGQYTSCDDLHDMKWTAFGELERNDFVALLETMKLAHMGVFLGLLRKAREQKTESKAPPAKFTGCLKGKGNGAHAVCFALAMVLVSMVAIMFVLNNAAMKAITADHPDLDDISFYSGVRDSYISSVICIFISLAPEVCHPNKDKDQLNQKYAMRLGTILFFVAMGIIIAFYGFLSVGISVSVGGIVSLMQWGIELLLCTEAFRERTCLFCESWGCRCCRCRARSGAEKRNSGQGLLSGQHP